MAALCFNISVFNLEKKGNINKSLLIQQMFSRVLKFYKSTRKDPFCSGFLKQRYREIKQHVLLQTVLCAVNFLYFSSSRTLYSRLPSLLLWFPPLCAFSIEKYYAMLQFIPLPALSSPASRRLSAAFTCGFPPNEEML